MSLKTLIQRGAFAARCRFERCYIVGGEMRITLPPGHRLDYYQKFYPSYDAPLLHLGQIISRQSEPARAIDIGANIGDSAAILKCAGITEVLCVEGNEHFLPYLHRNVADLSGVVVEPRYIAPIVGNNELSILTSRGTARLQDAGSNKSNTSLSFVSPSELLEKHETFRGFDILKLDTDGFDMDILDQFMTLAADSEAVILFECDPVLTSGGVSRIMKSISKLAAAGYSKCAVFDNYGIFVTSLKLDAADLLSDLLFYAAESGKRGGAVSYFDVVAVTQMKSQVIVDLVGSLSRRD